MAMIVDEIDMLKEESRVMAEINGRIRNLMLSGRFTRTDRILSLEQEMACVFRPLVNILGRRGEDRACALFDYAIIHGSFDSFLHSDVITSSKEYRLPVGRVDRLLEHEDGSFTVVEIKPSGSKRDQAHGLGQAIMYASSLREKLNDNRDVRAALFVSSDYDAEIMAACQSVGVEYLHFPLGSQKLIDELAEIHRAIE